MTCISLHQHLNSHLIDEIKEIKKHLLKIKKEDSSSKPYA